MSEPFPFPEPRDDRMPARWAKNPPWKDDPDLQDLIEVMQPLERDYWNEGGQPHSERQAFLARIDARWRRWKEIARQRQRDTQRKQEPLKTPTSPAPVQPDLRKLKSEVDRATKVMDEASGILRRKAEEESAMQSSAKPDEPDKLIKQEMAKTPSTVRSIFTFLRKFVAIGGGVLLGASWSMLQIYEYGLALLLLILGMGAFSIQVYDWKGIEGNPKATRFLKIIAAILIVSGLSYYSAVIVIQERGKSWSTLLESPSTDVPDGVKTAQPRPTVDDRRQRKLTDEQRSAMVAVLEKAPTIYKQYPRMRIVQISPYEESTRYASDIVGVISGAGWKVGRAEIFNPYPYYTTYPTGITILANVDEVQSQSPLVKILSDAFKAAGISHVVDTGPTVGSDVVLIIGSKGPGGS